MRAKMSRQWKDLVALCRPKTIPTISPAVVTLEFVSPRRCDPDNRAKFVLDGLVSSRVIADDGPPHLVELRLRSVVGSPAKTVVLVVAAGERG